MTAFPGLHLSVSFPDRYVLHKASMGQETKGENRFLIERFTWNERKEDYEKDVNNEINENYSISFISLLTSFS